MTTPDGPPHFQDLSANPEEYLSNMEAGDSYGRGWKVIFSSSFAVLLAVILLQALIEAVTEIPGGSDGQESLIGVLALPYAMFLTIPIGMSASWVFLKAVRKEPLHVADMFAVFSRNYWNAVAAGTLTWLLVIVGLVLLIVPGIFIGCRLAFVGYLVMDRKMDAIEAMKTSWQMTRGHGWTIFGMAMLAIPIIIGGVLALLVGVFVAVMWISAAFAVLYHSVERREGVPDLEAVAAPDA